MKNQKTFFFMMLFLAVVMLFADFGSSFVISYFTIMSSMFVISTISYDEFDNGYAFLFSLPFTRKEYALEKYVFAFVLGIGTWLLAIVMALVIYMIKIQQLPDAAWFLENLSYICLVILMASLMIPVQIKFGGEKGRIALIITVLVAIAVGYFAIKGLAYVKFVHLEKVLLFLNSLSVYTYMAIAIVVSFLVFAVSYRISCGILKKKEF